MLTSAPLLSRIMNMMKDSNQLCSTMIKQVFLSVHQLLYFAPSSLIWQHWNLRTQPAGVGGGHGERGIRNDYGVYIDGR